LAQTTNLPISLSNEHDDIVLANWVDMVFHVSAAVYNPSTERPRKGTIEFNSHPISKELMVFHFFPSALVLSPCSPIVPNNCRSRSFCPTSSVALSDQLR
jgi:hypothetical protein